MQPTHRRRLIQLSLGLDEHLQQSAEKIAESIIKHKALSEYRKSIHRRNVQPVEIDSDATEWFEETEEFLDG